MATEIAVRKALIEANSWHADKILGTLAFVRPLDDPCIRTHDAFGKGDISYPKLAPKQSPFGSLPRLNDLRKTLIREIIGKEEDRLDDGDSDGISLFNTSTGAEETILLLQNITNPSYTSAIPSMNPFFTTISGLQVELPDDFSHMMAITEEATIVIAPSNHLLELQHTNESYTYTTMMTGQVIWFVWPPTTHNLDCLKMGYEMFESDRRKADANIIKLLEYGVTFVQEKGDCVRLPPFCVILALSTNTTVLAKTSAITGGSFIQGLSNIPLLEAWWKTEVGGAKKRHDFFSALTWQIRMILSDDVEAFSTKDLEPPISLSDPLPSLLKSWDDVKAGFMSIMNVQDREDIMARLVELLRRCKGNSCFICGKSFGKSKARMNVEAHISQHHWVERDK
ncbi:hypothetical protein P154DRAFT_616862 [Amniculicola lignicola CBS 123094]|uniref:Uncharacterized protein n=1 Tax=Amniculicola lignicola CBS 123094 TaxID=1392246 RepID=A0A6A5WS78_9PLEO|nr:hypothetical protein P154DRAFT_616862 [Amniculicola lignicola CBS 123094]